ncbi:MAG TPA: HAD-IIIA family hydrolase [Cyclobacteriaceae bacterium]|nr:HAD-IIIA family hydrolase [Cyclobacteriaceae bacterium]
MKEILEKRPRSLVKKASHIKALIFDVDGVLTDGKIIYDDSGRETKSFNVKDGLIIAHLRKAGIIVGVISGRESEAVSRRASELRLDFCHQGIVDKLSVFTKLIEHYNLKRKEVAYIGDDINDLAILRQVGIGVCPSDAPLYVKSEVEFVSTVAGGQGVVRDFADFLLAASGYLSKMLKSI